MPDFIEEMIKNAPKWVFRKIAEDELEDFSRKIGYNRLISKILLLRGIKNEEDLKHYLYDDINSLNNPFLFTQMPSAVNRVKKALHEKEKILIFGDRDADGVLSTAMLYNMLKRFDADVFYKVPEGECGYGIKQKDIDFAVDRMVKLIITVDTGVSSISEIDYANSLGIDTIIIDHHVQPGNIPNVYSILNPKMEFETYPYKQLSAGGVVLKFIHAFILSHTKHFNRVFVPIVADGDTVKGAKVKNGIIEEYFHFEESINYPIENNSMIVRDIKKKLPGYITSWLGEKKIDQLSLMCSEPYDSIKEFAHLFSKLYLRKQKKCTEFVRSFIDLSAISTISDIMPLIGENRIIVKEGIKQIKETTNLGLNVLLGYCNLPGRDLTAKDIAWNVSPLINSAGRMGDALIAVDIFTVDDVKKANDLSKTLIELNEKRKEKGKKNLSIINPIIEDKYYKDPAIVLATDHAEHGVSGIIATRIARKYSKPAIIIVNDENIGIGSGRGSGNFDLVSIISKCADLLIKYGGHKSAIGFTIEINNIDIFRKRVHKIVQDELDEFKHQETIEIDDIIAPDVINFQFLSELNIFEPTGTGNSDPYFSIVKTMVINPTPIGEDKNHIRFLIPASRGTIPVIGWGLADKGLRILKECLPVDIVVSIEDNYFRGERSIQLVLHDLRLS